MSENKILIPAILTRYSPKVDKSWSLSLNINEPNAEQKVIIDRLFQQPVYVMLKNTEISKEEQTMIEALEETEFKTKTQSQRIRNVLYLIWEKKHKAAGLITDKEYYKSRTEKIIEYLKKDLE